MHLSLGRLQILLETVSGIEKIEIVEKVKFAKGTQAGIWKFTHPESKKLFQKTLEQTQY